MRRWIVLQLFALLLTGSASFADPRLSFDEGLQRYRSGDMPGAIQAWEGIVRQGKVSGPLLYNLGNAYYRSGEIGRSMLYYERAKKLMPRDHDLKSNLELAQMATVDKIDRPLRLVFWDWIDAVRDFFSLNELARLFQIIGFLVMGAFLFWRFGPLSFRRSANTLLTIFVAIYALSGCWYFWRASLDASPTAIVMVAKTDVYSAPDLASTQLFSLHEGTRVSAGEKLTGWVNIRLADGRRGWVQVQELERI